MGTQSTWGLVFKSSIKSQSNSPIKHSRIMQVFLVALLVVAASAHPTLLKHKLNNAPVLNLNHKNVHLTQQVPVLDTVDVVAPQMYTTINKEVVPQMNTTLNKQVVPQTYTTLNSQVIPQTYSQIQPIVTPIVQTPVFKTIQTQAELTEGYVAANHGAVHTAPMPEGPSNDGFFASHHINLPNVKA